MARLILIHFLLIAACFQYSYANNEFAIETSEGEEVVVDQWVAETADAPILIWLTEGYAENQSFIELTEKLQQQGNEVWSVDLMTSYFMEPSNQNARKLTGEGVRSLLEKAQASGRPFTLVASGRMALAALRGARLWQLNNKPEQGRGNLLQVALFFPNLFDSAEKAGNEPELFPIVSASSLPITIFQPEKGTYILRLDYLVKQLEQSSSIVYIYGIKDMLDWYFVSREMDELEPGDTVPEHLAQIIEARDAIPKQIAQMNALWTKDDSAFVAVPELGAYQQKKKVIGLTPFSDISAHEFTLQDTQGKTYQLEDYRGKVLLLNFWASWCPPCVEEIPSMNRLSDGFDKNDFEIVSVNFKESADTIDAFMEQVKVDFPVLLDEKGEVANQWNIFAFPASFLLDKNLQVRYSVNSAIEWDEPDIQSVIQSIIDEKQGEN